MEKIIKSNILSRQVSAREGSSHVSLFNIENVDCDAIYLKQNQEHTHNTGLNKAVLFITEGSGEFTCKSGNEHLTLQLIKGDIVFVPPSSSYTILNLMPAQLVLAEIMIC